MTNVRYEYRVTDNSDGFQLQIVKKQEVGEVMKAVKAVAETPRDRKKNMMYLGSIPNVIALQWANESGTRIYSKEWKEYVVKKLADPDFKHFRGHGITKPKPARR